MESQTDNQSHPDFMLSFGLEEDLTHDPSTESSLDPNALQEPTSVKKTRQEKRAERHEKMKDITKMKRKQEAVKRKNNLQALSVE